MMAMIGGIMRGKEPNVSVSLSKGWELLRKKTTN